MRQTQKTHIPTNAKQNHNKKQNKINKTKQNTTNQHKTEQNIIIQQKQKNKTIIR